VSTKPVGYLVQWSDGHIWSDGTNLILVSEPPSTDFLHSLGSDAKAIPVIRWKPSAKRPHERGTT
jgi:hypothetical protein